MSSYSTATRSDDSMLTPSSHGAVSELRGVIDEALRQERLAVLPPRDVKETLALTRRLGYHFDAVMLDPWYNKGVGGFQEEYLSFFLDALAESGAQAEQVFFWGFPEIVAPSAFRSRSSWSAG
jgi:hypothetical protein